MAAVISARLIPWEPGMVPGIAYELDDGSQACVAGPPRLDHPGPDAEVEFCRSS